MNLEEKVDKILAWVERQEKIEKRAREEMGRAIADIRVEVERKAREQMRMSTKKGKALF